jgi:UDP-N-acetyl-D-mannosaminuronate dehydrogenase
MPAHVIQLLEEALLEVGKSLQGARILVLGYAYLEDSDDTRNSPSETLGLILREKGAEPVIHDPFVPGNQGNVYEMAQGCNAAVLMVAHSEYKKLDFGRLVNHLTTPIFIQGREINTISRNKELLYKVLGTGTKFLP